MIYDWVLPITLAVGALPPQAAMNVLFLYLLLEIKRDIKRSQG
jgi:hypothetical protein